MRFGSLFSGIEAVSVAWKGFGEPEYFAEVDQFCHSLLYRRYPGVPNYGNVLWEDFVENIKNHEIDVLVGGSPCQSFSEAGARLGTDDPRGELTQRYFDILGAVRPRWFLWENVPGVLQHEIFGSILRQVGQLGYRWAYRILDARYFGVPHHRRRVFLVGCHGGGDPAKVLFESDPSRDGVSAQPRQRKRPRRRDPLDETHGVAVAFRGGAGKTLMHLGDDKAYCLRTTPGYGGAHVIDRGAIRRLTPRECERVQGFPDDYTLLGKSTPDAVRYKALGNSMAVPVIRWIGQRIDQSNRKQQ